MVSPNLKRTQCAANEGLANKISFAIHLGAETCEVFEMDMIPAYFCPTLLCRPFIMRSDSELLIFIFRSEKKMGLLIMQTDFAKSDGMKSDLRIRWPKSSDFGPKSDDSTHRIIKSENGIGL